MALPEHKNWRRKMDHRKRKTLIGAIKGLGAMAILSPGLVMADYPDRPVQLIVPFPPGGPSDNYARILASALQKELGQTVVVVNKPGVSGALGIQYVARSKPDGYTYGLAGMGATVFLPLLTSKVLFDNDKDLTFIGDVVATPNVFIVGNHVKVNDIGDLISQAKKKPGAFSYASTGVGSTSHVLTALFEQSAGVELLHVPYKGAAPALQELMSGLVDIFIGDAAGILPMVNAGKARALFVVDKERMEWLPDLPSAPEIGLPDVYLSGEYGLVGPAGLDDSITTRIHSALTTALSSSTLREKFSQQFGKPVIGSGADYKNMLDTESKRWSDVVKSANITLD